jgi:hypothetical protein
MVGRPRLGWFSRRDAPLALAFGLLVAGCEGDDSSSKLDVTMHDDTIERRAEWKYTSFEVDVVLTLITRVDPESCISVGTLTVDEALASKTRYDLLPTDCTEIELTDQGDIVLHGDPTNHDWSTESLSVDTDAETITLGPVALTNAEGEAVSIRFTLSSPPCPDDSSCKCGLLRRSAGTMNLDLSLGKRC